MEHVIAAWTWFKAHFTEILALWATIIGAAEIVVKWTDTKKDDVILGKVRAFGVWLISILTKFGFEEPKQK